MTDTRSTDSLDRVANGPPDRVANGLLDRVANGALALLGGVLVALSLPPWGWWPLAFVGLALFDVALGRAPSRSQRFRRGLAFGAGWMFLGMGWMTQLSTPGYIAAGLIFSTIHGAAAALAPTGRWSALARPAAHACVEALRFSFPFGGVPLASLAIGQVAGPLAETVRVAGAIGLTWVTLQLGMSIPTAVRAWRGRAPDGRPAAAGALAAVALVCAGTFGPDGSGTGRFVDVAAVQGGGEQGTRALDVPSRVVTERHLEATASITAGGDGSIDVVLWPENTVDVNRVRYTDSEEAQLMAAEAARLGVPLLAGITEDEFVGPDSNDITGRYTNAQVVLLGDGSVVDRYDKVRRVPFGEYVPLRGILERITSQVDIVGDAVPGGPKLAYLDVPLTDRTERFATVISWEVFFGGRAREGVKQGATLIVNPTNGASYTGTIVQTQQVASSRLRALESGRWVVQAAPTGFTAFISPDGDVVQRTGLREQRVLSGRVELRDGLTWYHRTGDAVWIMALVAVLLGCVVADQRSTVRSRRSG